MKMSVVIIAAALGAIATPAFADQPAAQAKLDPKTGKYCISQEVTGSRIANKICRTKEEWAGAAEPKKTKDTDLAQK